ncbi:serine/threonine protein kinase [Tuwongella immobilis]|uniref:Protein kinase domain-containing protein n=1 Tax=Tuwongella immobilis TaxID=692036 RepID=A0A6C2YJW5_9BACT
MPAPATVQEFLELVQKSGVVDEGRLKSYLTQLKAGNQIPAEPNRFAGLLIREGILTHFQAEQFLQGRWKRFHIGRYKVLERLGAGGMGQVFLCEHKLMRRRVAVKVLPTNKADDQSSLERFYREARAVAALDHPNIVRAFDIDTDENLHFLVMEYVDGSSIQDIVKKFGPMDVLRSCHYISQAAQGLQHAHESGLVHRDIKPGNLLIDRAGVMKILDMGLARFFHDEEDIITKRYDENVLGTADYLAPEQVVDSHSVDIRADIYSLGATFYFMLTGSPPFHEGSVAQKLIYHQTKEPRPIGTLRPEVPPELIQVVQRMMTKDPTHRFQVPNDVIDALAPFVQVPIAIPPDKEMPQLCLAAQGQNPMPPAPPPTGRPTMAAPAPPPRSNPGVRPMATPSQAEIGPPMTPRPAQQMPPQMAPRPKPPQPQLRPASQPGAPTAPQRPAPQQPLPVSDPYQPVWENLTDTADPSRGDTDRSTPPLRPESGMAFPMSSGGFPAVAPTATASPPAPKSNPGPGIIAWLRARPLVIGLGAVVLLTIVAVALMLNRNDRKPGVNAAPNQALVGPGGQFATLREAIEKRKPEQKELLLLGDLNEGPIRLSGANSEGLVIRPMDPARTIVWSTGSSSANDFLLTLREMRNLRISGIEFRIGDKMKGGISIYGVSPGLVLENITITGGKESSLLLSCQGSVDSPVLIRKSTIRQPGSKAAVEFSSGVSFVQLHDCKLIGDRDRTESGVYFMGSFNEVELARLRVYQFSHGVMIPSLNDKSPKKNLLLRESTFSEMKEAGLSVAEMTQPVSPSVSLTLTANYFHKSRAVVRYTSARGVWKSGMEIRGERNARDSETKPVEASIQNPNNAKPEDLLALVTIPAALTTDPTNDRFLLAEPGSPLEQSGSGVPSKSP